jgi:LuxR family maltose regulon positive regulatory protein
MSQTLLSTKFIAPVFRSQNIGRPQLRRKLRLGLECKLILVSAPPGFGKTTLLAEWLCKLKMKCAWLSLDEQDSSPYRFINYFIGAIRQVIPDFGQPLLSAVDAFPQPPLNSLVASILNELTSRSSPLLIVLDDYQLIEDRQIHEGMMQFINHMPPTIHLCVATRSDPPWKIARLRTQQNILEIRTNELRFTLEEASQLINQVSGLALDKVDLQALTDRTEGWVAALQMAINSLKNTKDAHSFISSFTGTNRAIVDYLIEEVLSQQSVENREFLIKTSVLDQLSGELCDSILGHNNSICVLNNLERANLFLLPVNERHSMYRYHRLFRELLQNQLGQYPKGEIGQLHRNATAWFLVHDDPLNSLKHAIKAGDLGIAASIAEQHALNFLDRGQISKVSSWLDSLPPDLISNWPWLLISHAWVDLYIGKINEIDPLLELTFAKVNQWENSPIHNRILGHIYAIQGYLGCLLFKPEQSLQNASKSLKLLPESDCLGRCHAYMALGQYFRVVDNFQESVNAFENAIACTQNSHNEHLRVLATGYLAQLLCMWGKNVDRAQEICSDLLAEYATTEKRKSLPALAFPMVVLSQIQMNIGNLRPALEICKEATALSRFWQHADTLHFALAILTNLYLAIGDPKNAKLTFQEAHELRNMTSPCYAQSILFMEMQYYLQTNQFNKVSAWAQAQKFDFSDINQKTDLYILYARFLISSRQFQEAVKFTERLIEYFKKVDIQYGIAIIMADQARAYVGLGMLDKAIQNISDLLALEEPERIAISLSRQGVVIKNLLKRSITLGKHTVKARRLLEAIYKLSPNESPSLVAGGGLYLSENLTGREVEIIKLLDSGKSSTELAKELVISPATVRTHIKSIYRKLGASCRIEALRKAKENGILQ